jgi:hypothetical protein
MGPTDPTRPQSEAGDLPIVAEVIALFAAHDRGDIAAADLSDALAALDWRPVTDDLRGCLTEAGIALHDCDGPGRAGGGCCLTVNPQRPGGGPGGVIVSWICADSLADGRPDGDRWELYQTVLDAMNEALWVVLDGLGFPLEPFGLHGLPLVVGPRPDLPAAVRPFPEEDLERAGLQPLYGEPVSDVEILDAAGRLGRHCAACARPFPALHYPQARDTSGVCCDCWDGRVLVATLGRPEGEWVDLGRCHDFHPDPTGPW